MTRRMQPLNNGHPSQGSLTRESKADASFEQDGTRVRSAGRATNLGKLLSHVTNANLHPEVDFGYHMGNEVW
jgi:hypothetical protein